MLDEILIVPRRWKQALSLTNLVQLRALSSSSRLIIAEMTDWQTSKSIKQSLGRDNSE
jgi:hypothetical protein